MYEHLFVDDCKLTQCRRDYTETISIHVGHNAAGIKVHKSTICACSPYFETQLSGAFKEAKEKIVRLEDVGYDVFEAYVHWAYYSEVDFSQMIELDVVLKKPSYLVMAKLWILADRLLDHKLCNRIADIVIGKFAGQRYGIKHTTLQYVWEHTAPDSPLRRLYTDICTMKPSKTFHQDRGEWPRDLVLELATRFMDDVSRLDRVPSKERRCSYHMHAIQADGSLSPCAKWEPYK